MFLFQTFFSLFCRFILYVTGWTVKVHPDYNPVLYKRQVMVYPHSSAWDLVLAVLIRYAHNIQNARIIVWNGQFGGLQGMFLEWLGCIPVENQKATGLTSQISEYLKAQDSFIFCISPEGTRAYKDRFRSGFYYIAKNTEAVYSITIFDYEKHVVTYGKILTSSNDFDTDCRMLMEEFSKGVHLHNNKCYGCASHGNTSMVDWLTLTTLVGVINSCLIYHFIHPVLSVLSGLVTLTSFFYHQSKEDPQKIWRALDWLSAYTYIGALLIYRWMYFNVWRTVVVLVFSLVIFIQAGRNKRYENKRYVKWHIIYHLSTLPLTLLEILLHL